MEKARYEDVLSQHQRRHRWLLVLIAVVLLSNALLVLTVFRLSDRQSAWLVPLNLRNPTLVSTEGYSASYLASVAEAFVSLRLNFTPQTIKTNQQLLTRFFAPGSYSALKASLAKEAHEVKAQGISSSFALTDRFIDAAKQQVRLTGVLNRWVGGQRLPSVNATFVLTFTRHHGLIQIARFEEEKHHG